MLYSRYTFIYAQHATCPHILILDRLFLSYYVDYFVYYRCVDVTGAYSAQKTELNISLTAVGLLWTMTDFIAKGLLNEPFEEKETGLDSVFKPCMS